MTSGRGTSWRGGSRTGSGRRTAGRGASWRGCSRTGSRRFTSGRGASWRGCSRTGSRRFTSGRGASWRGCSRMGSRRLISILGRSSRSGRARSPLPGRTTGLGVSGRARSRRLKPPRAPGSWGLMMGRPVSRVYTATRSRATAGWSATRRNRTGSLSSWRFTMIRPWNQGRAPRSGGRLNTPTTAGSRWNQGRRWRSPTWWTSTTFQQCWRSRHRAGRLWKPRGAHPNQLPVLCQATQAGL